MRKTLLFLIAVLAAAPSFARSLFWESIDVKTQLDSAGVLHIAERQAMVFDGDWNGGERTFRLQFNQKLKLNGIARIDDSGREIPLERGELSTVNHYDFTSPTVVRWRSRLPGDPPFSNQRIVYALDYTLTNVLVKTGDQYRLDHDFAFPNREGAINRFSLDLTFDPAWKAPPIHIERENLQPGQSVVVTRELTFSGAGAPAAFEAISDRVGPVAAIVLIATMLLLAVLFRRAEGPTGRFAPTIAPERIDEAWIREHLLSMRPEVAGAMWDGKIGAPEVAAVLARLTAEGKLTSRVEKRTLSLHRNQPLDQFDGYERDLLHGLFFDSKEDTDTNRIKAHYKDRGFEPSSLITSGIGSQMTRMPEHDKRVKRLNWSEVLIMFGVSAIVLVIGGFRSKPDAVAAGVGAGLILFFTLAASGAANFHRSALTNIALRLFFVVVVFSPAMILALVFCFFAQTFTIGALTVIGTVALAIAGWKTVLDALKTPQTPEYIAFRKRLLAARDYFASQLRSEQPRLRDEWLPYLLAFGLGSNVDRWFRSFAGRASNTSFGSSGSHSTSSTGSSTSSSPGWTGGGGAFGGAGATGGWALAAGALAAGVSAPSSSGSGGRGGGGGGGGGGSSGGGGGGGW